MEEVIDESGEKQKRKWFDKAAVKQWFVVHKVKLMKFGIVFLVAGAFTTGAFFLFRALGFFDQEQLSQNMADFGFWIYVIFIALFVLQAVCISLIPGNTTMFITFGWLLFDNFWVVLLLSVIGVWLSGIVLFWIGRFGGRQVLYWVFDKQKLDKYLDMLTRKGSFVLPGLFLIPFMPNDLMCMICGTSKLKFWQFLLVIIPCRVIEVTLILTYPIIGQFFIAGRDIQDVLIFFNLMIINVFLIFLYYRAVIKIFKKTVLRKKYVTVEKPYMVEEEVKT